MCLWTRNQLWSYAGKYNFNLLGGKLLECFPLSPAGALLFIRIPGKLIVGFSANPPEWKQIAKIDCLEEAQSVQICLSPLSKPNCCIVLIGTEDGHVYQLQLENPNLLTLLFDLQQPVVSILNPDNQTILVGRYGKIARLNSASKDAQVSFAPTDISDCFFSGRQLYLMGSDQLYSMELKQTKGDSFLGEANYCKVKFVRAINLMNETVVVLTENGTIYQSSLNFGDEPSSTRLRTGTEIKPILLEIHRCTDETKALGIVSQNVHDDITQISIALHMLNQTLYEQFPAAVRSFADPISPRTQRLIISVTNNSTWNLLSSHWAFQICANDTDQSSNLLKQEWKTDETLELEHRLPHLDDTFHAEVKISLVFRVIDPRKPSEPQSLCVFPLSTVELTVLDFLDPGVSDHFDAKNKSVDIIGFCRDKVDDCPWGTILQRSWHRGFAKWLSGPPPLQIVLLCGSDVVRMTLQKDENNSDKIWTLRIETSSSNLLRLLRKDIFRLIETNNPPTASEFVKVPSHVIAHLQVVVFFSLVFFYCRKQPLLNILNLSFLFGFPRPSTKKNSILLISSKLKYDPIDRSWY